MSHRYRAFVAVTYRSEEELIEALAKIESRLGKYDFFSHFITLSKYRTKGQSGNRQKIFSMKKLLPFEKLGSFYKKVSRIQEERGAGVSFLPGCLNENQVLTLHEKSSPEKIQVAEELFARLEFTWLSQSYQGVPDLSPELDSPDALKFFEDLRRIYQNEV